MLMDYSVILIITNAAYTHFFSLYNRFNKTIPYKTNTSTNLSLESKGLCQRSLIIQQFNFTMYSVCVINEIEMILFYNRH